MDSQFKLTQELKNKFGISLRPSGLNPKGLFASNYNNILKKTSKRSDLSILIPEELHKKRKNTLKIPISEKKQKLLSSDESIDVTSFTQNNVEDIKNEKKQSNLNKDLVDTSSERQEVKEFDETSNCSAIARSLLSELIDKADSNLNKSITDNSTLYLCSFTSDEKENEDAYGSISKKLKFSPSDTNKTFSSFYSKKNKTDGRSLLSGISTPSSRTSFQKESVQSNEYYTDNSHEFQSESTFDKSSNTLLSETTKNALRFLKAMECKVNISKPSIEKVIVATDKKFVCRYLLF